MNSPADRRAIEEATANLLEGVNSSSVIQVLSVWADDGVLMPPNHPAVHGRAAIEAYFRTLFERGRFEFVFTSQPISIDGDTAIQRLSYTAKAWLHGSTIAAAGQGKGLHVWGRRSGHAWKLEIDVWNSDAPPT